MPKLTPRPPKNLHHVSLCFSWKMWEVRLSITERLPDRGRVPEPVSGHTKKLLGDPQHSRGSLSDPRLGKINNNNKKKPTHKQTPDFTERSFIKQGRNVKVVAL